MPRSHTTTSFYGKMEVAMALGVVAYTLPSSTELLRQYAGKAAGWIDIAVSPPGAGEFRAYRSTDGKEVLTMTEYDSVASAEMFVASDSFKTLLSELEKAGCTNIQVRTWDKSPVVAQPVRARAAAV
jgi:hypothetical protein